MYSKKIVSCNCVFELNGRLDELLHLALVRRKYPRGRRRRARGNEPRRLVKHPPAVAHALQRLLAVGRQQRRQAVNVQ